jgi:hypothetical protein
LAKKKAHERNDQRFAVDNAVFEDILSLIRTIFGGGGEVSGIGRHYSVSYETHDNTRDYFQKSGFEEGLDKCVMIHLGSKTNQNPPKSGTP